MTDVFLIWSQCANSAAHSLRSAAVKARQLYSQAKAPFKLGVGASTACQNVHTAGTDGNLSRLVPVLGHGARVQQNWHGHPRGETPI